MVEMMFYLGGRPSEQLPGLSHNLMLLSGPPSCGKTSLLFQFAFNSVSASVEEKEINHSPKPKPKPNPNPTVVFICNRRKLESKPPFLSQGLDPSSHVFNRIQIKYVDDEEGLKKFFAAFHLFDAFPTSVIIDDFGDFFHDSNCREKYSNSRGRDMAMVRTLALCSNALVHANETQPCRLLLSDTNHGDSPRLLFIYKRWIPCIFTIKGDGFGSFLLKHNSLFSGSGSPDQKKTAKYSIALQYLVLEGITEDEEEPQ